MSRSKLITNFVFFQLAWFSCVIGASKGLPWLGVIVSMLIAVWHLSQARRPQTELLLMGICLVMGGLYDQAIMSSDLISYVHNGWSTALVPAWILGLWLAFATLLNTSLRWMHGKYAIGIIFGAIGGPLAYMGAAKLGAVTLHGSNSYLALSFGWAIITPCLLNIAARFDGFSDSVKLDDKLSKDKLKEFSA